MDDYYCVEEPSDNEECDSSDDDLNNMFDDIIKKNFNRDDEDEDNENYADDEDFEKEMERERDNQVNNIGNEALLGTKKQEQINDDLFYDPESDERDQKWVDDQRSSLGNNDSQLSNKSDATLNCPCCMSLLCLDCQRHELYKTQYRAMFVYNCTVDFSQKLQYKSKSPRRNRHRISASNHLPETYYPVKCCICNTQVGVYDLEEVYHFFNVLSSYC